MIKGLFHQLSYAKLIRAQIPKVQKESQIFSVLLCIWDLCTQKQLKAARKTLMKSTLVIDGWEQIVFPLFEDVFPSPCRVTNERTTNDGQE